MKTSSKIEGDKLVRTQEMDLEDLRGNGIVLVVEKDGELVEGTIKELTDKFVRFGDANENKTQLFRREEFIGMVVDTLY